MSATQEEGEWEWKTVGHTFPEYTHKPGQSWTPIGGHTVIMQMTWKPKPESDAPFCFWLGREGEKK